MKTIKILDTTLRDGEQCLDESLTITDKIVIAQQLEKLKVDIIEAGFPITSQDEFLAVKKISETIKEPIISSVGRLVTKDLDRCWEAVQNADHPRVHTFIATSDIHLEHKLHKTRNQVLKLIENGVSYAKNLCDDIEFSAEDGSRTDISFLSEVLEVAIDNGVTTINIPDTVGYAQPDEFGQLIDTLLKNVPKMSKITLSIHCHNDLGLAVANSLSGIKHGALQVECTINGLGERAGNASLEEIVMAVKTRSEYYHAQTNIQTEELFKTSKLVSSLTGYEVQNNKAIVGKNAFVHKAGIHQHGILKNKTTYEIMDPDSVGWRGETIIISKHSGQHAIINLLQKNKIEYSHNDLAHIIQEIKQFTDENKSISNEKVLEIARKISSKNLN